MAIPAVNFDLKSQFLAQQQLRAAEDRQINVDRSVHTNPSISNPASIVWNFVNIRL